MSVALQLHEAVRVYLDHARSLRRARALAPHIARFAAAIHVALTEQRRSIRRIIPRPQYQEADGETALSKLPAGKRLLNGYRMNAAAAIQAGARGAGYDIGIGVAFNLNDPRATGWMASAGAELVTQIDTTTRTRMRDLLKRATVEGWSTDTLTDAINGDYSFSMARSRMIARTELANAHAEGGLLAARDLQDAGLAMEKLWLVNEPEDDACISNGDAGWLRIDDSFPSGDERPPAHPNCECDVEYRVADEVMQQLALDATPEEIADVLARRRAGESFPTIAKAHGRTSGPWAYAIVKKHAPEMLGRITPAGNVRVVRKPKAAVEPPMKPLDLPPGFGRDLSWNRPAPAAPPAPPAVETSPDWWKLDADEFQRVYPEFRSYGRSAVQDAINDHRLLAEKAVEPLTKWIPEELIPPHLRDIKVTRTTALPEWVSDKFIPPRRGGGVAALVASIASPDGKVALRPVPAIVVNDRQKFFTIDPQYTVAHELGHQAIYRAGLLQSSSDSEQAANLYADNLLGRKRSTDQYKAVLGYDREPAPADGKTYTDYGGQWIEVSDKAKRMAARAIANTTLAPTARVTMREAAARSPIVFGLWVCAEGVSVAAMRMEDV